MATRGRARGARQEPARKLASVLSDAGRAFYGRGWVLGTSGNFSAVLQRDPARLLITASGLDKGNLAPEQFLEIDSSCKVLRGSGKPSAEALLHLAIVRVRAPGAILHTHSVWSTLLSDLHATQGGLAICGYEMLKGLEGVKSHEHREWLPIVENSQDMTALAASVEAVLRSHPDSHGFLLCAHGLYTWGEDVAQARRHVEILEFLLEVLGRRETREAAASR